MQPRFGLDFCSPLSPMSDFHSPSNSSEGGDSAVDAALDALGACAADPVHAAASALDSIELVASPVPM